MHSEELSMDLAKLIESEMMPALVFLWVIKLMLLSYLFYKYRMGKIKSEQTAHKELLNFPKVCVQLPIYNEPKHCQQLIDCVSQLDWPLDQLEIQVLDDSNDHSSALIAARIRMLSNSKPGLKIKHIRRGERIGFKAGALNYGFKLSSAQYFAIFDCDFRPNTRFLKHTIPHFEHGNDIAAVQVPWGYYNANTNILTWIQSLLLICHFHRDHRGRFTRGYPFHFNGTAGVWKRSALEQLGGFSANTVTEDLYLSLKAWIKGYRIWYANIDSCKSELPPCLASFLIQQRRWAKGNGQVLRLLGKQLVSKLPFAFHIRADTIIQQLGYGISTFFLIIYFLSPFWINTYGRWLAYSNEFTLLKFWDLSLWLGIFCGFYLLFYPKQSSHKYYTHTLPPTLYRFLLVPCLVLFTPLFTCYIGFSFWSGVLKNPKKPSNLIFARTPKHKSPSLSRKDQRILEFMIFFTLICCTYAMWWKVMIPCLFFFAQTMLFSYLKFQELGHPIRSSVRNIRMKSSEKYI